MRKKFKKRLLGIILTILMVVSVIPVQQVQPVQAAMTLKVGDKIYFKVISRDNGTFGADNAVPAVYLKTSATDGSGTWQTMTEVSGESNIYQYEVDKDNVTYVAFRRMSEDGIKYWDSMTSPLEINGNMYTSEGWNNSSETNSNPQNWCTYSEGGETPDPTPSTSNTVYYKKSENSNDTNWDNATNFYVYGFNSDTDKSDIQPMRLTSTAGVYEYTFTKQYAQVIFLRTTRFTSSGKDYSNQTVNLTVPWGKYINPMFTLDGNSDSKDYGKKTGTWSDNTNASTGDEVLKERFYVSTNLVDYINDARFDSGNKTRGYSNNNQGTVVDGTEKGANVYSYLDAAISGSPWYNSSGQDSKECQYTYPLYFGNMFDTKNRYGRMLNGSWYGLNNFSVGANVALEETGTTTGSSFYGAAAQGLVGKKLVNGKMVDPNNENVVLPYFSGEEIHPYNTDREIDKNKNLSEYYNNLQFPFKQTMDKNGVITYSYDSETDKAVYYDFDNNSFYESNQYIQNGTTNDSTAPTKGFYPLNKPGDSREAVNMGFGTEFTIPFTLSKDGKINGQDITFNFTGDDDVWVFIDDYLVLDMGGAHRMASGTIDFAKKNVTVERAFTPDKSTTAAWKDGATRANQTSTESLKTFADIETDNGKTFADIMADDSKVHTLKMFYMERGMIDSNMSVSFNFSPIPSGLTLSKDVNTASVNDGLKSVVETKDNFDFTVTDTDTRTEYTYEKDYDGTRTEKKTTTNGVVEGLADNVYAKNFAYKDADDDGNTGLKIGTDFTITETENSNYDTRWFVTDISTGETKDRGDGLVSNFKLGDATSDVTKVNYNVNFVNTPKVGTVNITKAWNGTVPETLKEEAFPFKVEVDLDGAAKKDEYSTYALKYTVDGNEFYTDADGNFKLKCDQTAAFEGIPTGATVKVTETTTTDSKSWEVSGSDEAVSKPVTETSNETLTITNATKTKTSDKVIYVEAGKDTLYTPAEVKTDYKVFDLSNGLTYTEKGFNGTESNKSYTANYTGSNSDGAIVNGTITVLTYQATDKVYVFDYGLESNIAETNANGDGLFQGGKFYNEEAKGDMATSAKLGTITPAKENTQTTISSGSNNAIDSDGKADSPVTFKPVAFMDKVENYTYTANITKNGKTLDPKDPETGTTVNGTIKTMPANVVYYEDDFNANSTTTDGTTKIVYTEGTNEVGTPPDVKLTQSNGQTEQYGHDDAYTTGTGDSNGTSKEMTEGAKATFTFTGTGFDVIARTTSKTAGITYIVSKKVDDSWTAVSVGAVDTYYANGDLYQIPVIHKDLGEKNTYKVTLRATESTVANVIYLDGIRIYNPLETEGNEKYIDNEEGATFVKVSDLVLGNGKVTETGGIDGAITNQVIDGSKAAILGYDGDGGLSALGYTIVEDNTNGSNGAETSDSILQYLQAGPNNEVYLDDSAAVAFVAKADSNEANRTIQVEAKLADLGQYKGQDPEPSEGMELRVLGADGTENLVAKVTSSTAMYYSIDLKKCIDLGNDQYLVVIVGNSDYELGGTHCISFTNIKYKGYEFSSPYENDAAKKYIDMTVFDADRTKFASIDFPSVHKNVWSNYKCSVTLNENVFGDAAPKFKLYYKNTKGVKQAISVTAQRTQDNPNKYDLRFRAPNAIGNFAVELHYVVNGKESDDYIATTMTVKR